MTTFPDSDNFGADDSAKDKPDLRGQKALDAQTALNDILKNPSALRQGLLAMALLPLMFFTGFGAIGTFVFSRMEAGFYSSARQAEAVVLQKRREAYEERVSRPAHSGSNSAVYQTAWRDVYDIAFTPPQSGEIRTAIAGNASGQILDKGSEVTIYYDPENPRDARFASARKNGTALDIVWKVLLGAFLLSFFIFSRIGRGSAKK